MPCFYPLKAYRSRERAATGGWGITFKMKEAAHDRAHLELPCQKCIGCRVDRSRAWAVRCMHEAQLHPNNSFVTLTYKPEALPDDYSVDLDAYQKFLKRLRESLPQKIRFFGCAEYGSEEGQFPFQPHYHFLFFNYRPTDLIVHSKNNGKPLYKSPALTKLWPYGFNTVGELNYQTAAYCARYVFKKIGGELAATHYVRQHPVTGLLCQQKPEFSTQSRRPGLGSAWLEKYKSDIYPSGFVVVDGKEHPVPPFYHRRLEKEEQEQLKKRRALHALEHKSDNTHRRRQVRETVLKSRISQLKRNI